jgi:ornithine decarboxylase
MAKFILSKSELKESYQELLGLGCKVSYSCKTNWEVASVLQTEEKECEFSVHNIAEIERIRDKGKVWFFPQALSVEKFKEVIGMGVRRFVVDHELDLDNLLSASEGVGERVDVVLRMKMQEHRVGSGRYFVYGFSSKKVNELIAKLFGDERVEKLGVHVHRKSQNTSEWSIVEELEDSLSSEILKKISLFNMGGGMPIEYKTYSTKVMPYIFDQLKKVREFLEEKEIEFYVEPGRFLAGPCVKLEAEVLQIFDGTIVLGCSVYNSAIDSMVTNIRMLVEDELEDSDSDGESYLIKGNTPTRDDIFRYKVKLKDIGVGSKIVFLNAGAYNYWCDFCSLDKLETEVVD